MTKTIIIDVKRPATVDRVQIDLPHYSKLGNRYFAVTDETVGVQISCYPSINCYILSTINEREIGAAFDWEAQTISAEEFNEVLETANATIAKALKL